MKMCTNSPSTSTTTTTTTKTTTISSSFDQANNITQFDFNANIFKGFMASGLAAIISKTTVAPMDRIKLILQLQNGTASTIMAIDSCGGGGGGGRRVLYQSIPQYNGIIDCFRKLCVEQGVVSLWRGNVASVIRCLPSNTLNLALRDYYRPMFLSNVDRKTEPKKFAAGNLMVGGLSAATALCFVYPLDFARTRIAVDVTKTGAKRFNGIFDCFKNIYIKEGGPHGLYRGFFASLQFVVISRAIFFGIFDTTRAWLSEEIYGKELSFITLWCLAQASIITSSIICYPLDTVRRKLMMQSGQKIKTYKHSLDCFAKIFKNEGASALYKGALSNSLKCTSGALILAIYYEVVKYI